MTDAEVLDLAVTIAVQAHRDQVDKAGWPYILHPLAVMHCVDNLEIKAIAVLHDVAEDAPAYWDVVKHLLPLVVQDTVENYLTHRDGEAYMDYIHRVGTNSIATLVKLADLGHNSDESRITEPTQRDRSRWLKYKHAIEYLEGLHNA